MTDRAAWFCAEALKDACAPNFSTDFSGIHPGFFVNSDADGFRPLQWLAGNDNISGLRPKDGILPINSNQLRTWTMERQRGFGNLALTGNGPSPGQGFARANHSLLP